MPRTNQFDEFEIEKKKRFQLIRRRRRKLIKNIEDQINLANSMLLGEPYTRVRKLWQTNELGERTSYEKKTDTPPWWWDDGTGNYFIHIWYGHRTLDLPDGTKTIHIGSFHQITETLKILIKAVNEGSFDNSIMKLSNRGILDYYLNMPAQRLEREKATEAPIKPDLTKNFQFLRPCLKRKMLKILERKSSQDPKYKIEQVSIRHIKTVEDENHKVRRNIMRCRKSLVERLEEQIGLANQILYNTPYVKTRTVWRTDENGNHVLYERPKNIQPWWDMDDDRRYYIQIRYDRRILKLPDGTNRILVGPLNMLIEQFYGIIDAVNEGQFDDAMLNDYDDQALRYLLTVPLSVIKQKKIDLEKANVLRFEKKQETSKLERKRKKQRHHWIKLNAPVK